jgi:hypothetical protein
MKKTMTTALTKHAFGRSTLGMFALALGLGVSTVQGATTFTGASSTGIHVAGNWNNGLPTGTNAGTVATGFATSFFNGFEAVDWDLTYNGTSSLGASAASLRLDDGTTFTFNDSSTLTVDGRLNIGFDSGSAELFLNDNASATVAERVVFGGTGATGGSLSLAGNSSFATSALQVILGNTGNNYNLTLSDAGVFESNATSWGINANTMTVNFEQADQNITPTFKLNADGSTAFSNSFFIYQIDGVSTTLADERFVLTEGSTGGFDTLTLTTIPEPSSFALLGGCLALTSVMLRRRR